MLNVLRPTDRLTERRTNQNRTQEDCDKKEVVKTIVNSWESQIIKRKVLLCMCRDQSITRTHMVEHLKIQKMIDP